MAESARLEIVCPARDRGFESHLLRQCPIGKSSIFPSRGGPEAGRRWPALDEGRVDCGS